LYDESGLKMPDGVFIFLLIASAAGILQSWYPDLSLLASVQGSFHEENAAYYLRTGRLKL